VKCTTSKDQTIGGLICTVCVTIAIAYTIALFWPALEATPPPKPLEEIPLKKTEEEEQVEEKEKE